MKTAISIAMYSSVLIPMVLFVNAACKYLGLESVHTIIIVYIWSLCAGITTGWIGERVAK